ncbi:uncharacterized protein LOC134576973 [Pelobates fuscus]|uniref:uncharacterized protein LOC134576973 n=1 Tax=Pelobates fuscus TaxID=191477 RepID=UPI002FE43F55
MLSKKAELSGARGPTSGFNRLTSKGKPFQSFQHILFGLSDDSEDAPLQYPKNSSTPLLHSYVGNDAQVQTVSQSYLEDQIKRESESSSNPSTSCKPSSLKRSKDSALTVPKQEFKHLDDKLDSLITIQQQNSEILRNFQTSISTILELQKKTNRLLKSNFKEMQNSLSLAQKMSKGQEEMLNIRINTVHTQLNDLKDTLHAKFQNSTTSDDSDEDSSSVQKSTYTPAFKKYKSDEGAILMSPVGKKLC